MSENLPSPPKRSAGTVITILIVVLVGVIYVGWSYLSGNLPWQQSQEETAKISWMKKNAVEVPPEKDNQATINLSSDKTSLSPEPSDECSQTADKILLFFEHLDSQNFIREYSLKGSTADHINEMINKLMANPPVVVRETDDLFAILNNMTHFFRILGRKDILLTKDILIHERELVESFMALLYKWSEIEPECPETNINLKLPLAGLYEYAGYFINTLGGQSYLFRRSLYLRLLIRYYSILIIDRTNSVDANRYGIDIRYTLDALISEIQTSDLENRQDYLETLIRLQENYQAKYGSR